ncbi:MAG: phosphodiester glycosidase family protein, partial [Chloroflexota bacterium]
YGDFAGMFAVSPDGRVSVRWLRDQPYNPDEPLKEALQSFPVLVKPGGVIGFPADADDGRPARRTVVARDLEGRILFIVAPRGYLSLHELACFLAGSDLNLDVALNLDGGFSTGLWLKTDEMSVEIDSLVPVPSVISAD